ncbi:unnamed protein product [Adineta steineri]|uniref:Uncharacterized protein n=1 Tax=Adineta steineri TaxID=433720 RepID=A0A814D888_9BILA|nr:unnamed protein product [Adineta steineri]CAF4139520.1 unnamed protein product [Adineta steineri]
MARNNIRSQPLPALNGARNHRRGYVIQQWNPYEIPITTDTWTQNEGIEFKLTAVAIEGTKTHPNAPRDIICDLEDTDENELSNASPDSGKSRLALVLRQNNDILWETLVLSDAMILETEDISQDDGS